MDNPHASKDLLTGGAGVVIVALGIAGLGLLPQVGVFVYGSMAVIAIGVLVIAAISGPPGPGGRQRQRHRHAGPWLPQFAGDLAPVFLLAGLGATGLWLLTVVLAPLFRGSDGSQWFLVAGVALLSVAALAWMVHLGDQPPGD